MSRRRKSNKAEVLAPLSDDRLDALIQVHTISVMALGASAEILSALVELRDVRRAGREGRG